MALRVCATYRFVTPILLIGVLSCCSPPAFGQGGVYVDPGGVLRQVDRSQSGRLGKLRNRPNVEAPGGAVADASALRRISLPKLQEQLRALAEAGTPVPGELRFLGGLTRIQYVFVYPEDNDLVIAGPAEGWETNRIGEVVGVKSGQPVIHLDDLVVALRALGPGATAEAVGCSIDPTKDGLARLRDYLSKLPQPKSVGQAKAMYERMREALGLQDVRIFGVPADSHFASVLVEADYRMKRTALGLENPRVKNLPNTLELQLRHRQPGGGSMLYRWWFTPQYEAVLASDDGLAFELRGPGLRLLSETQFVSLTGQRKGQGKSDPVSGGFAAAFTGAIPALCQEQPIYAALRNLADLSIFAGLIAQRRLAEQAGWDIGWLLDPSNYTTETYPVAKQADSLSNFHRVRRDLSGMAGGVTIRPADVLTSELFKADTGGKLAQRRSAGRNASRAGWWWD